MTEEESSVERHVLVGPSLYSELEITRLHLSVQTLAFNANKNKSTGPIGPIDHTKFMHFNPNSPAILAYSVSVELLPIEIDHMMPDKLKQV